MFAESGLAYAKMLSSKMLASEFYGWDPSLKLNKFKKNDFSWVGGLKYPLIKSEKLLLGFRFSYSLSSIHSDYKLHNMDYGIEIYYLFNQTGNSFNLFLFVYLPQVPGSFSKILMRRNEFYLQFIPFIQGSNFILFI